MSKPASPLWQIGGVVSAADARVRSFTESFPARRTRVRAELAGDPTTAVLVALLVGAWCIAGVLDLTGLPHGLVMLVDLSEVVLCVWLGARLVFARELPRSMVLVVVYALFVLTGLVTHASPPAVIVALSHWLVLPALAFFVAARGTSERRAIVVVATLLALGVFEFLLTLAQSFGTGNPDAIVGSFGTFGSAVTATVVLIVACVAVAGYLIRAPFGTLGLASAAILPLFSAWAQVKIVPVFLPVVTLAVVVPALVLRQTSWRRGAASMAAVMASAGLVLAFYAVFHPYDFKVLTSLNYAQRYDATPSLPPGSEGSLVLSNYGNASLSPVDLPEPGSVGFKVANVAAGNYTVWMAGQGGSSFRVARNRSYVFSASVESLSAASQTIEPQIDWQGSDGHVIATIRGRPLSSFGVGRTLLVLVVSGRAPAGAVIALPKIAVVSNPPADSAILAESLRFERGSVRSQLPGVVLGNYGNASLSPVDLPEPGSVGFKVANVAAGNYMVWMAGQGGAPIRVAQNRSYVFSASVKSLSAASQTIEPQIDWQGSNGHVIATIRGRPLSSFGVGRALLVLAVSGRAPAGAVIALPKIAVISNPPADSAILAESLRFERGSVRSQLPGVVLGNYGNASLSPAVLPEPGSVGFKVANVAAGNYTVWMAGQGGSSFRVARNRSYVFSASVKSLSATSQTIEPQIDWQGSDGHVIATIRGRPLSSFGVARTLLVLVVSGRAPAGAVIALPKIAVINNPPAGSAILAESLRFERGTVRSVPPLGSTRKSTGRAGQKPVQPRSKRKSTGRAGQKPVQPRSTRKSTGRAGQKPVSPAPQPVPPPQLTPAPRPVYGRVTQWRMAEHAISGSLAAELFGHGLGSATVAVNLGVDKQDISADAEAASYSDFGTLLVERGWIGVAIVAFFALAIAGTAFRIARALPHGRWTTALTLAVPGVVAVMAAYGMMASNLRGRPAALTFWLVVALGLSPGAFLGGRPWRRASTTSPSSSTDPTGVE